MGSYKPLVNRALWLASFTEPLSVIELPVPEATAGTVVVEILATPITPYATLVHTGKLPQLHLVPPLVPNPNAVGRVYAAGPDAVRVKPGDLVYVDSTVRGRDDPDAVIMSGRHGGESPQGQKLLQGEWRDGALQQYQKVPSENVHILNEQRLVQELGYSPAVLQSIAYYCVAGGALLEAADARVGDNDADTAAILRATPNGAGADVYNDWTPGSLKSVPFLFAAVRTLKRQGRVVLNGGTPSNLEIPYAFMVHKDLKVMGKWMCSPKTLDQLIDMIQQGHLKIGVESGTNVTVFTLDEHQEAIAHAAKHGGWRDYTVIAPNPLGEKDQRAGICNR